MFGDIQSTREVFAGAVADDDLVYIVLVDAQGQVFASHGLESISIIGCPRPIVLSQGYSDRRSWHEWTC
jgi:hypothetical protein